MTYKAIRFTPDNKCAMAKFLSLPKKLYGKDEIMQDRSTEYRLLTGMHTLSRYFDVYPIIVLDEHKNTAARCVVTVYPDCGYAYLGYFECIRDPQAAQAAVERAKKLARALGRNKLIGPVDCSFWIRYRLKTNRFGRPYTGEPYNKDYYPQLFDSCGFRVCGEYISNKFPSITDEVRDELFEEKLWEFTDRGYTLVQSTPETFDKCLRDVYRLLIELFSDFPVYSRITEDEFCEMYSSMGKIIDHSMVRLAYYKGEPVGFFVSVPDMGNAVSGRITPDKLIRILTEKKKPKCYIMLYMGAAHGHHGLGKAMSESIKETLAKNGAQSVSALIRKGKVNSKYFASMVEFQYEYKLYETEV